MNNYFVILAAGKSKRFHKNIAKQFYNYKNKDIIEHSIEWSTFLQLFELDKSNLNLLHKFIHINNNKIIYKIIYGKDFL